MKNSIIREMFLGKRGNDEAIQYIMSAELRKKETEVFDAFAAKISSEARELYERYDEILAEAQGENEAFHFAEGFKLGILVGIECGG